MLGHTVGLLGIMLPLHLIPSRGRHCTHAPPHHGFNVGPALLMLAHHYGSVVSATDDSILI